MATTPQTAEEGWARGHAGPGGWVLAAGGRWTIHTAGPLFQQIARVVPRGARRLTLDLSAVSSLDVTGAWLLHRTRRRLEGEGRTVRYVGASPEHEDLLELVHAHDAPCRVHPIAPAPVVGLLQDVGEAVRDLPGCALRAAGFLGISLGRVVPRVLRPWRVPLAPLFHHLEHTGVRAIPIVALTSALVGVVLAYQGAVQLRTFGAQVLVVDLVGVSLLREGGLLLTAVIVAGRSGSAFTAQIGAMQLNEEIAAMRTMALDPVDALVLPRVLALVLAVPALTFVADLAGLTGAGLAAWSFLDLSPAAFLARLRHAATVRTFLVGMIKAPVFALVIGLVGCYQGLEVRGGATRLGSLTTRAVVQSIFLVIVMDALFSVLFVHLGL